VHSNTNVLVLIIVILLLRHKNLTKVAKTKTKHIEGRTPVKQSQSWSNGSLPSWVGKNYGGKDCGTAGKFL